MQRKLLATYLVLIVVTMIISSLLSWSRVNSYFYDRISEEAEVRITILRDLLEVELEKENYILDDFVLEYSEKFGSRITIIDDTGLVIAESDYDKTQMDDHKSREEVAYALENDQIFSTIRYSNTLNTYLEYVVIPIHFDGFDGVLRSAKPVDEIKELINETLQMIMIGILISAVIAFIVAYFITRRLMKPVNELTLMARKIADGDYDNKIYIDQKDEIGELAEAFNMMTYNLRLNMWELETKNTELESILTSMSNGIIVVDADYKVTLFNEMFIELFNVTDPDIKGKLFYEATRNLIVFQVLESSYENRENVVKEAKITTADGDKVYLLFASPIINARDKIRGTLLVVQDVTKIRKLETMRSDFVSNVTHELKTPLTSIRGFVDTLKNGALNEDVGLKFLDIIDIEAERLELLINDILILSEIESLMGDKNQGDYDLASLSNEVVQLLIPKSEKKGLKLITEYQEGLPLYECNPHRIKQLLINLMDNAVKYTEKGSVTIRLRTEYMGYIIEIEDTGIGIEKVHIPRLFERFYRVDGGRSRKMGGTGLGLSIVKHIVELYSGSIRVKSDINKGTKMTIRLPIKN